MKMETGKWKIESGKWDVDNGNKRERGCRYEGGTRLQRLGGMEDGA
jgi:hypothetical protein